MLYSGLCSNLSSRAMIWRNSVAWSYMGMVSFRVLFHLSSGYVIWNCQCATLLSAWTALKQLDWCSFHDRLSSINDWKGDMGLGKVRKCFIRSKGRMVHMVSVPNTFVARVHTEKESNLYRQQIYIKPIKCYVNLYESLLWEHFFRIRYALLTRHK